MLTSQNQELNSEVEYIAHPIGGDVKANIKAILKIIRKINLEEPHVIPFAPYMADVFAMDDNNPEERLRGLQNDLYFIRNKIVKRVRLYGNRISKGMAGEILEAFSADIPVVPMTPETTKDFYDQTYLNYAE